MNDELREHFLALMTAALMRDYADDPGIPSRVGKLLAHQADERARDRRDHLALAGAVK